MCFYPYCILLYIEIAVSYMQITSNLSTDGLNRVIAVECTALGWPLPALSWWIGKEILTNQDHIDIIQSNQLPYQAKLTLLFNPFSSKNNGSYRCYGINPVSSMGISEEVNLG